MYTSFKYRAYPTPRQKRLINQQLVICQKLDIKLRAVYESGKTKPSMIDMVNLLPAFKRELKCSQLINAQVVQEHTRRFYGELSSNAKIQRLPAGESTLVYPQWGRGSKISLKGIYLDKIGDVKLKLHRKLKGIPKTVTIKMTTPGVYHVIFTCEIANPDVKPKRPNAPVGIDFGCRDFVTLSDGVKIPMPPTFWTLRKEYRALRKKRKHKASDKCKAKLLNMCENVVKTTIGILIKDYDCFYVEDVNKTQMGGAVTFVPWRMCINALKTKCKEMGLTFILVSPHNTSKACSSCGTLKRAMPLKERTYSCDSCGLSLDRDINSAKVIMKIGIASGQVS